MCRMEAAPVDAKVSLSGFARVGDEPTTLLTGTAGLIASTLGTAPITVTGTKAADHR